MESTGGRIDADFLDILIDRVLFLPDHSLKTINPAFHNPDGIGDFTVMLETGIKRLVGFAKIGPES